jgi:hypothetical protein
MNLHVEIMKPKRYKGETILAAFEEYRSEVWFKRLFRWIVRQIERVF